ncbi:MAG TPA: tetraacyldisaccharide 4'-kinase [Acetobacteraceae bacterium]|nr:tetraacyldisaccharide 4'-kinase [Acetobacteraceae bacterium]
MHPPGFWRRDGVIPRVLSPLSVITRALTARRVARPGWRAPVPVICCGNVTVGGAGKTTVALDIGQRLLAQGCCVHFVLRGYGGTVRGPHRVGTGDTAATVGDEALLLAAVAPTWVGADRAASARAASAAGAQVLVMDDGLQNPSLQQDIGLLVIDGATGFGNGRLLPAGPLREPVAAAVSRCAAAVLIGDDVRGVAAGLPIPVLRARLVPGAEVADLRGRRVVAFAGIALPDKFFGMLRAGGVELADAVSFPDHHPYSAADLARLIASGGECILVTTPKDAVRLPAAVRSRVQIVGVALEWEPAGALETFLRDRGQPRELDGAQG